jgi:hypothetical protein
MSATGWAWVYTTPCKSDRMTTGSFPVMPLSLLPPHQVGSPVGGPEVKLDDPLRLLLLRPGVRGRVSLSLLEWHAVEASGRRPVAGGPRQPSD